MVKRNKKVTYMYICRMLLKTTLFLICVKYLFIGLEYCYFVYSAPFLFHNVSKIMDEIVAYGSSNSAPIHNIHRDTKLLYTANNTCRIPFTLLIVVKSAVGHFKNRNTIRRTWGKWSDHRTKVIFILGYDKRYVEIVEQENILYNDIVQGDFIDSYANNTYKTIVSYNWICQNCMVTDYVLFVDDDFFVHIPNVLKYTKERFIDKTENVMYGRLIHMARPIRQKGSKWYISKSEYPFEFWFPFLGGGSILTNIRVVQNMTIAIPYVKFVWIDDGFIGIVANNIGIKLKHEPGFVVAGKIEPKEINHCLTSHGYGHSTDLISAWNA